jgi:hypothetical protein
MKYKEIPESIRDSHLDMVLHRIDLFDNVALYKIFMPEKKYGNKSVGFEIRKFKRNDNGLLVSERIGTAKKYAEALDLAKRSV